MSPTTAITITFSELLVAGTVTAGPGVAAGVAGGNVSITPAPVVAPTLAVAAGTITLAGGTYASLGTYTVSVAGTVQSLTTGVLLGTTFTFSFTTRAWTTPPTTLSLQPVGEGNITAPAPPGVVTFGPPTVAGDTDGNLEQRGFVAFGLVGVLPPGAVVLSATYAATHDMLNTPYALGSLLAEAVTWLADGVLAAADFTLAPVAPLVTVFTPATAPVIDPAPVVFAAGGLVAPQLGLPNVGIRFRFTFATQGNGAADNVSLLNQTLTVVYGLP